MKKVKVPDPAGQESTDQFEFDEPVRTGLKCLLLLKMIEQWVNLFFIDPFMLNREKEIQLKSDITG